MLERVAYQACPLCEGTNLKKLASYDCSKHPLYSPELSPIISWQACNDCHHVFTTGYFDDEAANILSKNVNPDRLLSIKNAEQHRVISSTIIEKVNQHIETSATQKYWLDIGFGNGSLILTAKEYGYHVTGVDLREHYVSNVANFDIDVRCMDVLKLDEFEKFDVISMLDVLEHIPFPTPIMAHIVKLLKPDGLLIISMPNMSSFIWQLWEVHHCNMYWLEIEHCHNFSKERLYSYLKQFSLQPISYSISQRYRACMEVIAKKNSLKHE